MKLKPAFDWVYAREIIVDTGVVTSTDVTKTRQYYEVVAVGPGVFDVSGEFIKVPAKPGDKVLIEAHAAEGNTPSKMLAEGYALFKGSRIIAVVEED